LDRLRAEAQSFVSGALVAGCGLAIAVPAGGATASDAAGARRPIAAAGSATHGGWRYARWAMNRAQVRAASHGRARPSAADPLIDLDADVVGGFPFTAHPRFRRLRQALRPRGTDAQASGPQACRAAQAELRRLYGRGEVFNGSSQGVRWDPARRGTEVVFTVDGGASCSIVYSAPYDSGHE
jgi:hypothetical protein